MCVGLERAVVVRSHVPRKNAIESGKEPEVAAAFSAAATLMDSFSASDSLRALCAPLCCCLRGRVALSPSTDSLAHLDESAEQHAQDARLWPRNETSNELDGTLYSTEYEARIASANGGLQAPQDSTPQAGGRFPRSRQRRRGGDISGGGTDDGSGLTRWTLFRSWLRGGNQVEGAIRLGEAEDEGDFVARTNESSPNRLFGYAYGDEDAAPIALDDVALPPAPPHRAGPVPGALAPPPPSSSDLTSSDDRSNLDGEQAAQKEERRRRRRLRRRARELGLSVEDYEARIGAGWIDETQAETAGSHLAAAPSQPSTSSSRRSHRSAPDLDDSGAPGSGLAPEISATSQSA